MVHICVGNLTIIGSDNGLSPGRRQAIMWTNAVILLIGPLGTIFSDILGQISTFSFKKTHLKVSSENGGNFVSASMCWSGWIKSDLIHIFLGYFISIAWAIEWQWINHREAENISKYLEWIHKKWNAIEYIFNRQIKLIQACFNGYHAWLFYRQIWRTSTASFLYSKWWIIWWPLQFM